MKSRDTDAELPEEAKAELVASRRGHQSLRLQIPIAALAGVVGWMGINSTRTNDGLEQRLQAQAQAVAVLQSQQENIRATLFRIEALLEQMRQRQEEQSRRR